MFRDVTSRFHGDDSGAVAIMALVASLILILIAWVLFDAGMGARDKVEVQATADTAAYSQAAVKARSMNMLAYSNIAKRSVWGAHSLYPAYMRTMHGWIRNTINANCEDCDDGGSEACNLCNIARQERQRWLNTSCEDEDSSACEGDEPQSWGVFRHMSGRAYSDRLRISDDGNRIVNPSDFSSLPDEEWAAQTTLDPDDPNKTLFQDYIADDIRAIDNYQRYLYAVTPWWAWSEQLAKASRNGASLSSSWPAPVGLMPAALEGASGQLIDQFYGPGMYGFGGGSASNYGVRNYSVYSDSLPVFPSPMGTMSQHINDIISQYSLTNCIKDFLGAGGGSVSCASSLDPFVFEHLLNAATFISKSEGLIAGENDVDELPSQSMPSLGSVLRNIYLNYKALFEDHDKGVSYTETSFKNILEDQAIVGEPWLLRPARGAAEWQLNTSNIVLSYTRDPERFGADRDKFGILKDYRGQSFAELYRQSQMYGSPRSHPTSNLYGQRITYSASGSWALARSEVFFTGDSAPDLWHPSWSGRLRPIAIGDEFEEANYSLNQVYHDALPGMILGASLGMFEVANLQVVLQDLAYMEKASLAMDKHTAKGVSK